MRANISGPRAGLIRGRMLTLALGAFASMAPIMTAESQDRADLICVTPYFYCEATTPGREGDTCACALPDGVWIPGRLQSRDGILSK